MNINEHFYSLGSNYNSQFVVESIYSEAKNGRIELAKFLQDKYGGEVYLFYKGRDALLKALELSGLPKESLVAINGFTCFVVVDAIKKAGHIPFFLDIDYSLNFSAETLEHAIKKNKIKALVIQNTLGFPCDLEKIKKICKKNKIILLEDLAHSVGTRYSNGAEAGSVGDYTTLSFSQDKSIDAVSGGALIDRTSKKDSFIPNVKRDITGQDKYYPFLTFLIRKTYPIKIGKFLHLLFKTFRMLPNPMDNNKDNVFSDFLAERALSCFQTLDKIINHRRKIAEIYSKNLNTVILSREILNFVSNGTCLRFPIFVKERGKLIATLKNNGIYISDTWYDAPVAPKKYLEKSGYKAGQCPKSEKISSQILNLPTHINVSGEEAVKICKIINSWLDM